MLFFEFHGTENSVKEQAETVQEIVAENGGADFEWATRPEDRSRLWNARHNAYFAFLQLKPGCRAVTTDVCVPISRLAECVMETEQDLLRVHAAVPDRRPRGRWQFPRRDAARSGQTRRTRRGRADQPSHRRARAAHGRHLYRRARVGLHKMGFMIEEHGGDAIDVMRSIKHSLDPKNLMNPGKIFSFTV